MRTLPPVASLTVIDNASSDAGPSIAEACGAHVVRNCDNRGFGAAANQGAALGHADLILFLNPDAVVDERNLEVLVAALTSDASAAVAGPRLRSPAGDEQRPWWPFPSALRSWGEALGLQHTKTAALTGHVPFIVGTCFLVRRAAFEAASGFDERFWLYGEEADLCRRLQTLGWTMRYVPDAVALHVGGASGSVAPERTFEQFQLGSERFIAKHGGRRSLISHRLALLSGSAARVGLGRALGRRELADHRTRIVRRLARRLLADPFAERVEVPGGATDLVVLSLEAWDDVWRRNQFLVDELLKLRPHGRVLFVEPPSDVLHARRLGLSRPETGLRQLGTEGRVWALRPRKMLPRILGPWADRSLNAQLHEAIQALGFVTPTLWVNDATYAGFAKSTRWPILYDLTDDWLQVRASPRALRRLTTQDASLVAIAGVVTVCSDDLQATYGRQRAVAHVANAVDADHFRTPQQRPDDLPDGTTAVYVGTLHDERIDVALVERLASELPAVHVVLVGPDSLSVASRSALACHPNVHVLGPRAYAQVPAYLQHADVVIVPHVVSGFTESLDPIKAYECAAVGRPTIATPVAGFRDAGPPIRVAGRETFSAAVRESLLGVEPTMPADSPPSWTDRARAFSDALDGAREICYRVVYLDHTSVLSGGELALVRTIAALHSIRAHVILGEDGPLVSRLRAVGATVEVMELDPATRDTHRDEVVPGRFPVRRAYTTARYVFALARRLRELQPDVVHTNSLKAGVYGSLAARLAGVPSVWHVRDRIADDYLPPVAAAVIRRMIDRLPAAAVANSSATLATLGETRNRRDVVASPVLYDPIDPVRRRPTRDRESSLTFGLIGRIASWKGQDVFLRAFAEAFPGQPHHALIVGSAMFGETDYERSLTELVNELGLSERVTFTGFVDDVGQLLESIDVLVHASVLPEPFGQVIVEGMAAAVPVIAARAGGPAEIIDDGVNGLLAEPGDVNDLAAKLRRVADDPGLRAALVLGGLRRAEDFAPSKVAAQLLEVYSRVVR